MTDVVLGLDVGTATIGVAVARGTFIFPVTTIRRQGVRKDVVALRSIIADRGVTHVVIGLAIADDGTDRRSARLARQIGAALEMPVEYADERFTTQEARARLEEAGVTRARYRDVVDQEAAVVILEGWLASRSG